MSRFPERFKELLLSLGLTLKAAGERLSMDKSNVSRLLRNPHPKPHLLARIKKAFGVDAERWVHEDGSPAAAQAEPSADEQLRIVHLESSDASRRKPKDKRKHRKRKAFLRAFEEYVRLKAKQDDWKREKKRRKRDGRSGGNQLGGGGVIDWRSAA